jgi:hypothetical protein
MLAHAGTPDELVGQLFLVAAGILGWVAVSRLRGRSFPRVPRLGAWALAVLCVGALAAAVVVPSMMRPTWSGNRPSSDARVRIVRPIAGEVVHGDSLAVDIELIGGSMATLASTELSSSRGHLHVSIDGRLLTMTSAADTRVDISELDVGRHTLEAEFVAADHGPFQPRVTASVSFDRER